MNSPLAVVTDGSGVPLDGGNGATLEKRLTVDSTGALRVSGGGGGGGGAAGTEYTEDAAMPANPVGGALIARRKDTLTTSEVSADGDAIALNATNRGELRVFDDLVAAALGSPSDIEYSGSGNATLVAALKAIFARTPALSGGRVPTNTSNTNTKFREAFETFVPGDKWTLTVGQGDIVALDGNALAASYLVISKDPLTADSETSLESIQTFGMPFDAGFGVHTSQRTLGQEIYCEAVSDEPPAAVPSDIAISSIQQTTTTLTVGTSAPHGLRPGMRFGIRNCPDPRLNYSALVIATTPTPTTFTATAGPGGTIPSLTVGPFNSGSIYYRSAMRGAQNGTSMVFENGSATNAAFFVRSESGDVLPSGTAAGNHAVSTLTSASVQALNAALTYSFQPPTEFRLMQFVDGVQWVDLAVDNIGAWNHRIKRTQVVPDPGVEYKIRVRSVNNKSLTIPNVQVLSVSKTGTTTATVICAAPHGLTTGELVQIYGPRDQVNFPNLATPTAVTVVDPTTFTVVWGTAVTATSYGGFVCRPNGGQVLQGVVTNGTVQSIVRTGNILTVTCVNTVASILIGDYVNLVGVRDIVAGSSVGIDGAYRVRDIAGAVVTLEAITGYTNASPSTPVTASPIGIDISLTNCGGAILRRTDLRFSYARVLDFERQRVEMTPRPSGDISTAAPVSVQNIPSVAQSGTWTVGLSASQTLGAVTALTGGGVAEDAAAGANPVVTGGVAQTAAAPTTFVAGDAIRDRHALSGAKIVRQYAPPETTWNYSAALTGTTAVAVQAAAGAGLKRFPVALQAINTGASPTDLILLDGATERWRITLPVNIPITMEFPVELLVTANTALNVNLSTAVTSVRVNIQGYTAP